MLNTVIIEAKKISEAVSKKSVQQHKILPVDFENSEIGFARMACFPEKKKRTRLVVRKGIENISMLLEDIVLFYTADRIVYVVDKAGKKYIAERNLSELEQELDSVFFRANRRYIVSINYIRSFRKFEKIKLKINMNPEELNDQYCIVISKGTSCEFRKWIYAA